MYNTHGAMCRSTRVNSPGLLAVLDAACDADATALLGDFNEVQASPAGWPC